MFEPAKAHTSQKTSMQTGKQQALDQTFGSCIQELQGFADKAQPSHSDLLMRGEAVKWGILCCKQAELDRIIFH